MDDELTSADKTMRMDAYYYGFHCTGNKAIDTILSAVACAGKAYHHTEEWTSEAGSYPHLRGETPVDWIQNAANDAASPDPGVAELVRAARALKLEIEDRHKYPAQSDDCVLVESHEFEDLAAALAPFSSIEGC